MSVATVDTAAQDVAPLLFFSTRQGRQSNCVLTTEVARFVAEKLRPVHDAASAEELRNGRQDLFLSNAFSLFTRQALGPMFGLCALPRETEGVARMARHLEVKLALPRASTLCFHWRGEDFHHPAQLAKQRMPRNASSGAYVARALVRRAKRLGAEGILLLTNARYEALSEMLGALRTSGVRAESPRVLRESSTFGCQSRYVYGTMAEMLTCSRMRHYAGTPGSSFSDHIAAMRRARGHNSSTDAPLYV